MTGRRPEALRWIRIPGEDAPSSPGRCEVSLAGKGDTELLDAYSRAVTTVVEAVGAGSGVLMTPDGYVLTNHHVVREAGRVQLTLTDGTRLGAVPVGSDPPNDLALVRANGSGLPYATLGDSSALRVGQEAAA